MTRARSWGPRGAEHRPSGCPNRGGLERLVDDRMTLLVLQPPDRVPSGIVRLIRLRSTAGDAVVVQPPGEVLVDVDVARRPDVLRRSAKGFAQELAHTVLVV